MIKRIWHGWTSPENADRYEELLRREILPGIAAKGIQGYRGAEVLRRDGDDEVDFVTILTFDSAEPLHRLAGEDRESAYVPAAARELLARFDTRARHYQVKVPRADPAG